MNKEKTIKNSISLEQYGLNDLAWDQESAKTLIYSILEDKIGILGGDVYKITERRLEPLYDNWSCEPNENESQEEYYLRSKNMSLKYIKDYPVHPEEKIIFSITFTEEFQ